MSKKLEDALENYVSMQPFKSDCHTYGDHKRLFKVSYLAWKGNFDKGELKDDLDQKFKDAKKYRDDLHHSYCQMIDTIYQHLDFIHEMGLLYDE